MLNRFIAIVFLAVLVGCESMGGLGAGLFGDEGSKKETQSSVTKESGEKPAIKKTVVKTTGKNSVVKIDDKTFLLHVSRVKVWKALLDILSPDYNITVVDLKSGIITTDWDSFYIEGAAFRNRITLRTKRMSKDSTQLIINNKVERLKDSIWLASREEKKEVDRIVINLSKVLNQIIPPSAL